MSLLGIDIGTTGVRAACFDVNGDELASTALATVLRRGGGGLVETDAEAVLTAVEAAITTVVASPAVLDDPVSAVSFSVQGEAVVPVDGGGRALAGAPVSMDRRGTRAASALGGALGRAHVQQVTGQPLHPMFSVYKIAAGSPGWEGAEVAGYRCLDGFVSARLGARPTIDWSLAARTGAFDVGRREWSEEIVGAVRADGAPWMRSELLPEPVAPGTVIGAVSAEAAARTGLAPGVPIVAGLHDQAASFLGAGGVAGATAVFALGSSDCLTVATPERPEVGGTGFASYPVADGTWLTLAGTAAGGWALEWFAGVVGDEVEEVFDSPSEHPPALLVLPYFTGSGTLDNDPAARGVIAGLTLETGRRELSRAFLEATSFELAKILDAFAAASVAVGGVNAVGGGSANRAALGMRSSAAGVPLTPVPGHSAARGAALLAGVGTGLYPTISSLPAPRAGAAAHPDAATRDWYGAQRSAFRELYLTTRTITHQLSTARPSTHRGETQK